MRRKSRKLFPPSKDQKPSFLTIIWHSGVCYSHHYVVVKSILTEQKMKFSIKDFFSKCDQISSFLRIWSHIY